MAVHFIRVLEDSFGPLSKTLLFEYPTLRSVTEYFLHSYPKQLSSVLKIEEISVGGASPNAVQLKTTGSTDPVSLLSIHVPTESQQDKEARVSEIAIIGVAGRYPGARDLRAFWENL